MTSVTNQEPTNSKDKGKPTLRLGLIGCGGMGNSHIDMLTGPRAVDRLRLTAICDAKPANVERGLKVADAHGGGVSGFSTPEALMDSGEVDAVLIATPHYDHPPLSIAGMRRGLHVLSEKPAGVYAKQVREMNAVADEAAGDGVVFGIMFNQRTRKSHQQMRRLVGGGDGGRGGVGEMKRNMYVLTDWFRTQYYYDTADWKGTWKGEGGAVLLNQSPHNLDLWQWICGMPRRVRAFCKMGHHHHIETEDEVTAYVEYDNGATGVFVTSTGEAPGTQFLEVAGERGRVVMRDNAITWDQTQLPVSEFNRASEQSFAKPETWTIDVPGGDGPEHRGILVNFTEAVLDGAELIAPGTDGLNGVTLANAMLMSAWKDDWVELPLDDDEYHRMLTEKGEASTFVKRTREAEVKAVSSF